MLLYILAICTQNVSQLNCKRVESDVYMQKLTHFTVSKNDIIPVGQLGGMAPQLFGSDGDRPNCSHGVGAYSRPIYSIQFLRLLSKLLSSVTDYKWLPWKRTKRVAYFIKDHKSIFVPVTSQWRRCSEQFRFNNPIEQIDKTRTGSYFTVHKQKLTTHLFAVNACDSYG